MKVRLQAQRDSHIAIGVYAASNHSTTYSEVTVTTSGVDATTALAVGNRLYRGDGESYGVISSVDSATQFKFFMLADIPIVSGVQFYVPALDTFELDLQKEPNISINYQFDDVKNPDKTKGSFSQTFKLPFTDNNNKFFQDWYNVNLDTLVFSTKEEYNASIYVGTVQQFDGVLQLKSVYQKGQYYEVVVFSKISTLFSLIGDSSIRDAFLSQDGDSWNTALNHNFNHTQMKNSWEGSNSSFVNADGVSLKDPDHDIQKVMYPMSVTRRNFFFRDSNDNWYLNKGQDELDESQSFTVPITQFRPAIQLKEMIKIMLGKIGLSYTSNFFDSAYFSKIFMTTGGHLAGSPVPIIEGTTTVATDGQVIVGYAEDSSWGIMGTEAEPLTEEEQDQYQFVEDVNYTLQYALNPDTVVVNDGDTYNADLNYFTKTHFTQTQLKIKHRIETARIRRNIDNDTSTDYGFTFEVRLYRIDDDGSLFQQPFTGNNQIVAPVYSAWVGEEGYSTWHQEWVEHTIDISEVNLGRQFRPVVRVSEFYMMSANFNTEAGLSLGMPCTGYCGDNDPILTCATGSSLNCLSTQITMNYDGYDLGDYDAVRDVPACIDPELKQKDFFKDLIQRFNLVVTTNPNDPSNIVIEPYDTYLGSGTIRHWTNKLDLSKEVLIKDTSSLQKQHIFFTDKEDVDLYNKEIATRHEWANVYGHLEITETNNKWAKGELKNEPMFAPYINGWVQRLSGDTNNYQTEEVADTDLHNMAIQYEFSYDIDNDGSTDIEYRSTQPKLFWYNGTPTPIQNDNGTAKTIYMHDFAIGGWTAFEFTEYPLCSPYELTPDPSTGESTMVATTRSLYWDSWATPFIPDCKVFNWTEETPTNWNYTLYGYYWHAYLSSLHHPESRLMDCYLNLNAVDIFNFEFNDEIFIKDSYWRILKIHNYQVGVKTSTKVTLIKIVDTLIGTDCGYSISDTGLYSNTYLKWCPNTDTDCTPDTTTSYSGIFVPQDCCYSRGGTPRFSAQDWAVELGFTNGELPCVAYQGSLPISKKMLSTKTSIRNIKGIRSMGNSVLLSGYNNFSVGSGKTKGALPIMMPIKDDMSIKYATDTNKDNVVQLTGESHRIVLTGQTFDGVTSYAYPQGSSDYPSIGLPNNSNVMIRVNAISSITGGSNASYPVGYTESMSYYTAFKMLNNTGTQIGTAGGVQEFAIADGTVRGSLAITLGTTEGQKNRVLFGLVDGLTDVQRVWALTVDFHIQVIPSLGSPLDTDWALYQDFSFIQLQNFRNLLWN